MPQAGEICAWVDLFVTALEVAEVEENQIGQAWRSLGECAHRLTSDRTVVSVTFYVEDPLGRVALRTRPVGNCHAGCQPAALGAL